MNTLTIERLIMSRLQTWELFDKTKIARSNQNFTRPAQGVWLRVSIKGGVNHIASMADKPCVREIGSLIVQLFDHQNTGTKALKQTADSLARHMGLYQDGLLELLAPSMVDVGADEHGFYQMNVVIPYRFN